MQRFYIVTIWKQKFGSVLVKVKLSSQDRNNLKLQPKPRSKYRADCELVIISWNLPWASCTWQCGQNGWPRMVPAEDTSMKMKITRNFKTLSPSSSSGRCQQNNQMPKSYLVNLKQMKEAEIKGTVMSLRAAKWHKKATGCAADTAGGERSYASGRTVWKTRQTPARNAPGTCASLLFLPGVQWGCSYTFPEIYIYLESLASHTEI